MKTTKSHALPDKSNDNNTSTTAETITGPLCYPVESVGTPCYPVDESVWIAKQNVYSLRTRGRGRRKIKYKTKKQMAN
jgi:hypothetical protein